MDSFVADAAAEIAYVVDDYGFQKLLLRRGVIPVSHHGVVRIRDVEDINSAPAISAEHGDISFAIQIRIFGRAGSAQRTDLASQCDGLRLRRDA